MQPDWTQASGPEAALNRHSNDSSNRHDVYSTGHHEANVRVRNPPESLLPYFTFEKLGH